MASYTCLTSSILLNYYAYKNYDLYKNSYDIENSNTYYNTAQNQKNLSIALAITSAVIWAYDLVSVYKKCKKLENNITPENSIYYYEKSQKKAGKWGHPGLNY